MRAQLITPQSRYQKKITIEVHFETEVERLLLEHVSEAGFDIQLRTAPKANGEQGFYLDLVELRNDG